MYIQKSIKEYLSELGAKQPTPGGGSASALAGALGIALLEMVCNFTLGNKKYREFQRDIVRYSSVLKETREEFESLIDEDVKVYSLICDALKTKHEKNIDKALKDGYYISVKICELSMRGMEIALELCKKGNANLVTDVGCGAELLRAAFNSGIFNSRINLKGIKDKFFADGRNPELKKSQKEMNRLYTKTINKMEPTRA